MALFGKAQWHGPVPNIYPKGMGKVMGLVVHIMQSCPNVGPGNADTIDGCNSWFHNPASQVSAHFGTGTKGELYQWVDTADAAWAEVQGNESWVSIENSGLSGETLLPSQFESVAQVFAWLHTQYQVPLQATDSPSIPGLGWHGMGGVAWGDHLQCPGEPILGQRAAIIARARQILGQAPPGPGVAPPFPGRLLSLVIPHMHGPDVLTWQQQMRHRGWALAADGEYGPASKQACQLFQGYHKLTRDGIVGIKTWSATFERP